MTSDDEVPGRCMSMAAVGRMACAYRGRWWRTERTSSSRRSGEERGGGGGCVEY